MLIIIGVHPQIKFRWFKKIRDELTEFFEKGKGEEAKVILLYFQILDRKLVNIYLMFYLFYYYITNKNFLLNERIRILYIIWE